MKFWKKEKFKKIWNNSKNAENEQQRAFQQTLHTTQMRREIFEQKSMHYRSKWKRKNGKEKRGSNKKCCTCGLLLATVCPSGQTMANQGKWSLGAYADKRRGAPHNRPKRFPLNRIAWEGFHWKKIRPMLSSKSFLFFIQS